MTPLYFANIHIRYCHLFMIKCILVRLDGELERRCEMRSKLFFIFIVIMGLCFWWKTKQYEEHIREQRELERVAHLDVEDLDLAFIVNTVDELGGDSVQLNWKEIIALLGVVQNNYMYTVSYGALADTATHFIDGTTLLSFDEALDSYSFTEKQRELAHQYLSDLDYVGYISEKLQPSAPEAQFINQLVESAKANYFKSGILPSITIAQAILESNWGNSELAQATYNLFGIKADANWEGPIATFETMEYSDLVIQDDFRKYDSWQQSIDDHANFLLVNPRYQAAGVFAAKTYRTQAQALQDAGYSTVQDETGTPVYAKRLGELIRQYNLQIFDHDVMEHTS